MEVLEFNSICDDGLSIEELINFFNHNSNGFKLPIPYSYIGISQSQVDIMYDHLEMSFCIEAILEYATFLDYEINYNYKGGVTLEIRPTQFKELASALIRLCTLKAENKDIDEDDLFSIREEIEEYRDKINMITPKFPQAIDDYYANLINGGLCEMLGEFLYDNVGEGEQEKSKNDQAVNDTNTDLIDGLEGNTDEKTLNYYYSKNPEWRWGIWKSAASNTIGEVFYVSTYCWIIPVKSNYSKILKYYSGFRKDIYFESATILEHKGVYIAINEFGGIRIDNLQSFTAAIQCSKLALSIETDNSSYNIPFQDFKAYISEFRDVIMLEHKNFRYAYFSFQIASHENLKQIWEHLSSSAGYIQNLLGINSTSSCDWDSLNDNQFEELCYDILCIHTKFDSSTIRKMGKSKSRDGGRDIVILTNSIIDLPEKYIFQCKLLKRTGSLTKSKIPEAANTIMEYGANGYGIFTSGTIDSTLYDLLDGFTKNSKIKTDIVFSVYELEKFLARNKGLKNKYFPPK